MRQNYSGIFLTGILALFCGFSKVSMANRCEWNKTFNQAKCCSANEQALWNELFKRVECVRSDSGDSCVWDNRLNRVRCCDTDEHAVWDPRLNRLLCHRL